VAHKVCILGLHMLIRPACVRGLLAVAMTIPMFQICHSTRP